MFKILLLDDDNSILEVVSLVLTRKKLEVIAINDPSLLNNLLEQHHPDLLLMDIALGTYDGRNICREIKDSPAAEMPVILFSAQSFTDESICECKADAVIKKP
ncbi:MAG TPA: response regulator, partial [Chitinophaga sp.]|nr:response regulator [Chitinophaga sp.]